MNTTTLAIQSYRKIKPASVNDMRAVSNASKESITAAVISITDKTAMEINLAENHAKKGWVMPPVRAYFKGRDNDPL